MYEAHQIVGGILFGALGLYLIVFWGSALIAYIYGSYLHDGDKKVWSLPSHLAKKKGWWNTHDNTYYAALGVSGVCYPFIYFMASVLIIVVTDMTGTLVPYTAGIILGSWFTLYTLRAVIRLNKKLDKHEKDTNAHKGEQ